MSLNVYKTIDELITSRMSSVIPDNYVMPKFPVPTEDIDSIDSILQLIDFLKEQNLQKMCPKYHRLVNCENIIREFNTMIGLKGPKAYVATQILSLCDHVAREQKIKVPGHVTETEDETGRSRSNNKSKHDFQEVEPTEDEEPLLNTVIYGPPGCGKTTVANFLAKLYLKFGVLENGKVIKGDRANLIGEYVGDTAIKTKKRLTEALGGVLFIDEAYQLGHAADGNRCPFAYECINTITQFITEHKGKIVIILAGYKQDIKQNFFAQNEGLDRRFPWEYTLEKNAPEELVEIFTLQAQNTGYTVEKDALTSEFFTEHKDLFEYSGGDTQTFFDKCKMIHDKRMFSHLKSDKNLNKIDIDKGFIMYKKAREEKTESNPLPFGFYT
jgi:SpoVK/Ycf46/Vps4 family AAA+-type ATPase